MLFWVAAYITHVITTSSLSNYFILCTRKGKMMQTDPQDLPALVKEVRRQLSLSQESLARELGVSFATVNRWENSHVKPSKLARAQLDAFCSKMIKPGKLNF